MWTHNPQPTTNYRWWQIQYHCKAEDSSSKMLPRAWETRAYTITENKKNILTNVNCKMFRACGEGTILGTEECFILWNSPRHRLGKHVCILRDSTKWTWKLLRRRVSEPTRTTKIGRTVRTAKTLPFVSILLRVPISSFSGVRTWERLN